jgi:hypothetical protein
MRVAPVSADLLIKLGIAAALLGAVAWGISRAARAAGAWMPDLSGLDLEVMNPASDQNLIYRGTSGVVSAVTGRDETLGTWLYGLTHTEPNLSGPAPVLVDPDLFFLGLPRAQLVEGSGGAAFGIYPRP